MGARPTIIRNARILTMLDGEAETRGDVLIEGGAVRRIGNELAVVDADIIDADGGILLPGFVDTHRHVWQTQLRSTAGDWTLYDYLARMRLTYSAFYRPEDVYLGNLIGALDALNSGITTVVDHCHILNSPEHTDEAIRGLQHAGIRATFCYGIFANPKTHTPLDVDFDMGWRYADARRIRAGVLAADDGVIRFGLAPNEPESAPFEAFAEEVKLARDLGAKTISAHVAMGAYDQGACVVEKLHAAGLLLPEFLFVHGASLTDRELALIAEAGAGLSSTPETELQMGMGNPVALRARAAGVCAGLGVDIVSNYSGDLFAQMRMMAQSSRALAHADSERRGRAPRRLTVRARDILRLATRGGAEALHLEQRIGAIAPGMRADLVLIGTKSIGMTPTIDPVSAVVFNATAADVEMVMVDGRVLKRAGRLVGVDWAKLRDRLLTSSERIVTQAARVDRATVEHVVDGFFANLD